MNEKLPKGWEPASLDEIAHIAAGGPAPQEEKCFSVNGTPFVRVQDLGRLGDKTHLSVTADRITEEAARKNRLRLIPEGAILFTKSGASTLLNQRAILAMKAYVVSHIGFALPFVGISGKWIYWGLKQIDFGVISQSTVMPSLRLSEVIKVKIPVPPEAEQHRIVAEIEKQFTRLDAGIAALNRIRRNLKRYRAAALKAACEGRLVPTEAELARKEKRPYEPADQLLARILKERRAKWESDQLAKMKQKGVTPKDDTWKAKYKEPARPETSHLPELPVGWVWASIEQVAVLVTKGSSPGWQGFQYVKDGIPFIRSQNVRWSTLDLSEVVYLPPKFNEAHSNSIIREGDVLVNLVGASVGRSAIATHATDGANTNQAVGIIRLVSSGIENNFLPE